MPEWLARLILARAHASHVTAVAEPTFLGTSEHVCALALILSTPEWLRRCMSSAARAAGMLPTWAVAPTLWKPSGLEAKPTALSAVLPLPAAAGALPEGGRSPEPFATVAAASVRGLEGGGGERPIALTIRTVGSFLPLWYGIMPCLPGITRALMSANLASICCSSQS